MGALGRAALVQVLDLVDDVRNGRVPAAAGVADSEQDQPVTPCPAPE